MSSPSSPSLTRPIAGILLVLSLLFLALPSSWKGWVPAPLRDLRIHLGLDLAGGTQLDFRISEDEISDQLQHLTEDITALQSRSAPSGEITERELQKQILIEQRQNIIEAIRVVLERRLNALGVSETTITPSYVGGEKHLLVECPGIIDPEQCIATVGKTIQLEFKEEFTEPTEEFAKGVRANVQKTLERIRQGEVLAVIAQDIGDELGVYAVPPRSYTEEKLPKSLRSLWNVAPRVGVQQREGMLLMEETNDNGDRREQEIPGIFLAEVVAPKTQTGTTVNEAPKAFQILQKRERGSSAGIHDQRPLDAELPAPIASALREMRPGDLRVAPLANGSAHLLFLRGREPAREEIDVSHILVAYKGAIAAEKTVTRSRAEALAKIRDIAERLQDRENFEALARRESDGPSRKDGGHLGKLARGEMAQTFEQVAFQLPPKERSSPVETPFGFHILRVNAPPSLAPERASYDELIIPGPAGEEHANRLLAELQRGDLTSMEDILKVQYIFFSLLPTGWKDTPLDGKHFRTASATFDPTSNLPVVSIQFDGVGGKLFQDLTRKNVGKRLAIFVGGELISAPVVQEEIIGGSAIITGSRNVDEARTLAQDLNTGAIPAPIHLVGQRTVEATLGAESLHSSLIAGFTGLLLVLLYMLAVYRLLGLIACASLLCYCLLFLIFLKLPLFLFSGQYVVLTLAGIAGTLLSTGMAIDANVLIFERIKEELRKGKLLPTAVETGFERSWSAIWDSNLTTIITCAILFMIGTSIIRGFALTLGFGVLLSMFTAITVTRWILRSLLRRLSLSPTQEALYFGLWQTPSPFEGRE